MQTRLTQHDQPNAGMTDLDLTMLRERLSVKTKQQDWYDRRNIQS